MQSVVFVQLKVMYNLGLQTIHPAYLYISFKYTDCEIGQYIKRYVSLFRDCGPFISTNQFMKQILTYNNKTSR